MSKEIFNLSTPLITFSGEDTSLNIAQAVTSILITGGTGSGKSSTSSKLLANALIREKFGGIVLICKPEEADNWIAWCHKHDRLDDIILLEEGGQEYFNFIEVSQRTKGLSYSDNIFQLLNTIIQAAAEKESGHSNDIFWEKSLRALVLHLIDLSMLAFDGVDIQLLYDLTISAPKPLEDNQPEGTKHKETIFKKAVSIAKSKVATLIAKWRETQDAEVLDSMNEFQYEAVLVDAVPEYRKFKKLDEFFMNTYYNITSKTRGIIDFSVTGFLEELLREPIYSLFCRYKSTFSPEDCYTKGSIILINLPVMIYEKAGQYAQMLVKYVFQKIWEKRDMKENERPVFIFADECQNVLLKSDADFLGASRGNRISTIYITQHLSAIYSNLGGVNSVDKGNHLLGNLATHIYHANGHQQTNQFAADQIGRYYMEDNSSSMSFGHDFSMSESSRYDLQYAVQPSEFMGLKTGGPENNFICEAYIVMQGKKFSNGAHFKKIRFNQL